ncbi:hypothetical protein BLOT_007852 [Blomia tropicalis]|nr:hypothetical protein BLOT_007852 [Blomia tropicalis]
MLQNYIFKMTIQPDMMGKNDKNWKVFQCSKTYSNQSDIIYDITLTELLSAKCFAHHNGDFF